MNEVFMTISALRVEETQTQGEDSTLENTAVCTDEIKGEIEMAEGGVTSVGAMEQPGSVTIPRFFSLSDLSW